MSGELEPHRDRRPTADKAADGEIPKSWVYWSVSIGVALGLLIMLVAEVIPLPHHVHHLDISDAFSIAWKIALLPPGVVTARIAVDNINLSKREHQHAVQVARSDEFDATQRRITELSAKASEQLGSDKAPVRIGGLTDLERLGQNNPELRQTVVDRICAYLQMPFTIVEPQHETPEFRQEKQVRLAAQRILTRHTQWHGRLLDSPDTFWPDITFDLSDADLINFHMSSCKVAMANFAGASFHGVTVLRNTLIDTVADFHDVKFGDSARFDHDFFKGNAIFTGATFGGHAEFAETTFDGRASFHRTNFRQHAGFHNSEFRMDADFSDTTFSQEADFGMTEFATGVTFAEGKFRGGADFQRAKFGKKTTFRGIKFSRSASFRSSTFSGDTNFDCVEFGEGADFELARFSGRIILRNSPNDYAGIFPTTDATRLVLDPSSEHLKVQEPLSPPDGDPQ